MCVVINATLMYNFQIKGKIKIMGLFTGNFYSKNLRMTTQINVIFPDVSNDVTPLYGEHRRFFIYFMDCQEIVMNGRDFLKLNIMQKNIIS